VDAKFKPVLLLVNVRDQQGELLDIVQLPQGAFEGDLAMYDGSTLSLKILHDQE
jgi:hypothetical protein